MDKKKETLYSAWLQARKKWLLTSSETERHQVNLGQPEDNSGQSGINSGQSGIRARIGACQNWRWPLSGPVTSTCRQCWQAPFLADRCVVYSGQSGIRREDASYRLGLHVGLFRSLSQPVCRRRLVSFLKAWRLWKPFMKSYCLCSSKSLSTPKLRWWVATLNFWALHARKLKVNTISSCLVLFQLTPRTLFFFMRHRWMYDTESSQQPIIICIFIKLI